MVASNKQSLGINQVLNCSIKASLFYKDGAGNCDCHCPERASLPESRCVRVC